MLDKKQDESNKYVVGGLELDLDTKEVTVDGKIIKVTPIELKILELLMKNPVAFFQVNKYMKTSGRKPPLILKQLWFILEIYVKRLKSIQVIHNI